MDLDVLVDSIKNFEGVSRKKPIKIITTILKDVYNIAGNTYLGFGDDASAIEMGDGKLVLLATDGMWGKLMNADPYWAGYCSVLVNVNDIAAMGGKPMAMVNVLSINNETTCYEVMRGIRDGCEKFGVPMIGGHVHPDTPYDALDVSIMGTAHEDALITSCDAIAGNKVIVAIDLDGQKHPKFALNWDTTTHKEAELVRSQIEVMEKLAVKKLVTAGKDISNPGILGTLGMLLEASDVGAIVKLDNIPRNESVEWEEWLKLYPGSGFVLTSSNDSVEECIKLLEEVNITANVVGEITSDKKLYLTHENQKKIVFNLEEDIIMGVKEEKS
ncbi:methanogenesis marker 2 protein [Methanobacterium alcaliphilum]|uniref:methanogenesis marker 2 protein n=1 Tax=Methanobacterium alcaliphilum TaxID=392018 RepID=UPI00200AF08A|nr:methanogenesis marker 2 protein [Methanobacterium alcaliphilum]MCK9151250.1 methanogenesis marker 2 protein [Methanobacterium alcaliphilum]